MNNNITNQVQPTKKLAIYKETIRSLASGIGAKPEFATTLYCSISC